MKMIEVHTSERTAMRRCPQLWWWKYRMGLVPNGESPDALWFGIGIHIALAKWYRTGLKRGVHPATTFEKWCSGEEREIRASYGDHVEEWYDEPKYEDALELGVAMLEAYVSEYGKDDHVLMLAVEQPFRVNVTHNGEVVAIFASTFDGVYRDLTDNSIWLWEHKSARQISTAYLALDDQAGAYWAVATTVLRAKGLIGPDQFISGIMYNFLRKAIPDPRPENEAGEKLNKDGRVSKKQPAPLFVREPVERSPREQQQQMLRLADEVRVMNAMRDGTIPVIKNTTRNCPFCSFFTMCTLHERGGNAWRNVMKADFTQQDPYANDRKSS